MAKDYVEERATRTRASAETRGRRTRPEDHRPYSPAEIDKLYARKEYAPFHKTGGDGLVDAKQHEYDVMIQKPQFPEDQHGSGYNPDVPMAGGRAYLRGGERGGDSKPFADHGHFDISDKPNRSASGGQPNKATGADCKSSPFSAAWRRGAGENF